MNNRVALLSDIHGNLVALEAVLSDIAGRGVTRGVILGDVAVGGPEPRGALARIKELGLPVVLGNTDAWLVNPRPFVDHRFPEKESIESWCRAQMTESDLAVVAGFKPVVTLPMEAGQSMLCIHGSPRSPGERILATTPDEELANMLGPTPPALVACGHTHTAMLRRAGATTIINPGNVGLNGNAVAEYAIVDLTEGRLNVEFRQVAYDKALLAERVRQSGMPHADWWLDHYRPY